jgi:hypothetical protein
MSDSEFNDYGYVDPPFADRKPKESHRATHIAPGMAAALAKESGVSDSALVASVLIHCRDVADARNSLALLKRNRPELWPATKKASARTYTTSLHKR